MRLFAAIELDEDTRAALARTAATLRRAGGARFSPPENYHLTLRFFGEVDGGAAERLVVALDAIGPPPPMDLPLVGPRWLPNPASPRVLAALAEAPPELFNYQRRLEQAARDAGLAPETRPYIPHVTLARIRDPRAARALVRRATEIEGRWATLPVRAAALVESRLSPEGATYSTRKRYAALDG